MTDARALALDHADAPTPTQVVMNEVRLSSDQATEPFKATCLAT